MSATAQHGYLLLADISGYTSFVAGTELEHSHEILSDLLVAICDKIESLMTIHKLEGDAVFAYISDSMAARGETLLELIESTYVTFRDKQVSMKRSTTCTCNACRNIPSLDLKFILHHGEYIVQQVREIRELVGSDVNLVHRLLKNHVAEATGWQAYVMFTEKSLEQLGLGLENTHLQREQYEHLGEIKTFSIDLHQRYKEITDQRRILIDEKDADIVFQYDFSTPPPVTWEWMHDPLKRNIWNENVRWSVGERPGGRAGRGASNHCAHGKGITTEVIVDWHPFEHSTLEAFDGGKKIMSDTLRFEPLPDGGTRVRDIAQLHMLPLPRFLRRIVGRLIMVYQMKYPQLMQKAARLAAEEYRRNKETDEA